MRLNLYTGGVRFQLKISGWRETKSFMDWDKNWCFVELSLESAYINYQQSGELLLSDETESICRMLGQLLDGTMVCECVSYIIEPDIDLYYHPEVRSAGKHIIRHRSVDFCVNFWNNGGMTGNQFRMKLYGSDCAALHVYLRYVMNQISRDDPEVLHLLERGELLPE